MNYRKSAAFGWIATVLVLIACSAAGIRIKLPSIPAVRVPAISVPSIPLPTFSLPVISLTAVNRMVSTPAPTSTAIPAVPVTGGGVAGETLQWVIYALLALIGIVLVIVFFARALKHPEGPEDPADHPDI